MKKSFKVIISMTLAMCLVVSQGSAVFAISEGNGNSNSSIEKKWYSDDELMRVLGTPDVKKINQMESYANGVSNDYSNYISETGTVITVVENTQERIELEYKNGDAFNSLILTDEGDCYVNGDIVLVTDENDNEAEGCFFKMSGTPEISPKAGFSTYYKNTCPYGKASDYTHKARPESNKNIKLTTEIGDFLVELFINLMCAQMQVGGEVATHLFTEFYYMLKETEPHTTAVSYSAELWTHKDYVSGYIPSLFTFVHKMKIKLYPKANFKGTPDIVNTYRCKLTV